MELLLVFGFIGAVIVWRGIRIVPQQQAWIVERFGKFDRTLEPGLNILIPIYERVAYRFGLKEIVLDVPEQSVITRDNVPLTIDGVIYVRIVDPSAAAYGVADAFQAVTQLAQTTMRSEIGKMTLDQTFEERERLNANIVAAINEAADTWGAQCLRYELKNINPPASVVKAMEQQVTAERQKRADILESEGKRQSQINMAEGHKQEVVLKSEAAMTDQINRAKGEAEAILSVAHATAESVRTLAGAITSAGGAEAVSLRLAEQYIEAFRHLAKESTTILLPAETQNTASMVAQATAVFQQLRHGQEAPSAPSGPWGGEGKAPSKKP